MKITFQVGDILQPGCEAIVYHANIFMVRLSNNDVDDANKPVNMTDLTVE